MENELCIVRGMESKHIRAKPVYICYDYLSIVDADNAAGNCETNFRLKHFIANTYIAILIRCDKP